LHGDVCSMSLNKMGTLPQKNRNRNVGVARVARGQHTKIPLTNSLALSGYSPKYARAQKRNSPPGLFHQRWCTISINMARKQMNRLSNSVRFWPLFFHNKFVGNDNVGLQDTTRFGERCCSSPMKTTTFACSLPQRSTGRSGQGNPYNYRIYRRLRAQPGLQLDYIRSTKGSIRKDYVVWVALGGEASRGKTSTASPAAGGARARRSSWPRLFHLSGGPLAGSMRHHWG
jgi:hypothetical protein